MPKKVFEFATEIGTRPLELVEKLKELGLPVKNHMSILSDEEIESAKVALGLVAPPEDESKKPKKKVVRKTKKDTDSDSLDQSPKIIRRKVLTRKSKEGEDLEELDEGQLLQSDDLEQENETIIDGDEPQKIVQTQSENIVNERTPIAPPVKEDKPEVKETPAPHVRRRRVGEVYKEKMHTFTPVYIPPAQEGEKKSDSSEAGKSTDVDEVDVSGAPKKPVEKVDFIDEEFADDDKNSKKRIGGLAAAMSKPKGVKVKDVQTERAEEELKAYALGIIGTGYYVPAKKKKVYQGPVERTVIKEVKDSKRVLTVHGGCTALELAHKLNQRFEQFADTCLDINLLVKEDDFLGVILASEIAGLYNYRVEDKRFDESKVLGSKDQADEDKSKLPIRSPVVTVMGHVDHGKTSLLDYIRKAKVAAGEAGGITQHVGAYTVDVNGERITFIDTPGHAAFASMRERGAKATDIVVLVVAADDGVMPQTKESVKFCKTFQVPIIVAINKIDKGPGNKERIKQDLLEFELTPEEWGGETQYVEVSAVNGTGVDKLLESILVQAEILELRADPKCKAEGFVLESRIEVGRGPIATVLVQNGTLRQGDSIVVGECYGRVRTMVDQLGNSIKEAGPSTPVQVLGLDKPSIPGDVLNVVVNEREAKKIVDNRVNLRKQLEASPKKEVNSLENFFAKAKEGERKTLNLIVRADVQGSYEAIKRAVEVLGNDEVKVEVISGGVGAINDNDVLLAASSGAYIIGFNMRPVTTARRLAEDKKVDIKTYSIIYELINDITLALEGLLEPDRVEVYLGRAEVRNTFDIPKVGVIAGSSVIDGKIQRGCNIRLLRDGKIVFDGKMSSLKRFKDDAKEVIHGHECGIALEGFNDVKISDIFEAYVVEEKKRKLVQSDVKL